jgi:hypothetical protein
MAIWQYKGELIPELWLIEKHGRIPATLENYLMTEDSDLDTFENPHCWRDSELPKDLVSRVEAILPPTQSWSKDALMFGDEKVTDFTIWYEGGEVDAIHFRWDLRQPDLEVLNQLVSLANRLGAYIVSGDRATVIEPNFDALLQDIKKSNAYRFCQDPEGFLRDIGRNQKRG